MSKPLVVSIPHRLGKDEATRRLRSGLSQIPDQVRTSFGHLLVVEEQIWTGDRLQFRLRSLGQPVVGTIDVADDHVQLEVLLPWLLSLLADRLTPMIRERGILMLEKK